MKGAYQSRLYNELGLESLKFKHFLKIKTASVPQYLSDLIPKTSHLYNTCAVEYVTTFHSRTEAFKYSVSQYSVLEWN